MAGEPWVQSLALDPAREKLAAFVRLIARRGDTAVSEEQLKPGFLADIFCELLGYRTPNTHPDAFTVVPEFSIPGNGTADAVLGCTPRAGKGAVMAVEIKAPGNPLDRPVGGRRRSAVEQGFDYAINLGCDWILVTSMAESRLYYKGADYHTYERFDLQRMVEFPDALRRFVYLLGAERVVPAWGRCHLDDILEQSRSVGENVTRDFYHTYSELRLRALNALVEANPTIAPTRLLTATQKILDRIVFCAFAEDRGLIPHKSIRTAWQHRDPYRPQPIWVNYRGLFRAIDEGSETLGIVRYNGGLFAHDPFLDALIVPDRVCDNFLEIARYEFRPVEHADIFTESAFPEGETLVDVEILGHIFEQSITDLERLRLDLDAGRLPNPDARQARSKRKKEGPFYTPAFIPRHLVEHPVGATLRERFEALRQQHQKAACATARKVRVLDPACGSGAFLIEVFDHPITARQTVQNHLRTLGAVEELFDLNRQVLQENLYGVDLNAKAVEIGRPSLWIKTAEKGKILTDLDHTIRRGNSLISDPAVPPEAFDYRTAFPEVFEDGGFDVVVGNPPYIRQEWISPFKDYLRTNYKSFSGTADLYIYFIERGMDLLKHAGHLGFVTSGTFARANFAREFRQWLPTMARITSVVGLGETMPFGPETFVLHPMMTVYRKDLPQGTFPTLFLHDKMPESIEKELTENPQMCDETIFEHWEWRFQPREITALFNEIMASGRPLGDVVEGRMYRGILTGLNEAFIIDAATRNELVRRDARSADILRPILKGEDLRPWYQDWEGRYLIFTRRGIDIEQFPAILEHLSTFREQLEPQPDDWKGTTESWPGHKPGGYKWYELQDAIDYYEEFDRPKIMWPDILKLPRFSRDESGILVNDKGFIMVDVGWHMLSLLCSRPLWFNDYSALRATSTPERFLGVSVQTSIHYTRLPIPALSAEDKAALAGLARDITDLARRRHHLHREVTHRLQTDLLPPETTLNNALRAWWTLDMRTLRAHLKRSFKVEIPVRERADWENALADCCGRYNLFTTGMQNLEAELHERAAHAYGLTTAETKMLKDFMRKTRILPPLGEAWTLAGGEAPGNAAADTAAAAAAQLPPVPPAPPAPEVPLAPEVTEVSEGLVARGPLRAVGMAAPLTVGGAVLRGVSTLVPPASVRLAPPPAWWLEHESQRLAALYPGLCPDGTHPLVWYGPVAWHRGRRRKPGWRGWLAAARPWAGAAALMVLMLAAVELAAQHYFRTPASMLGLGFVGVVLMHRLAVQAGFQRLLVEARQSRLFQAHIMAGDDIPGVIERFYALAVDRARPLLVCGLLLAAMHVLMMHGVRGMAGLAVVIAILMFVHLATASSLAPADGNSDSARAHLYLACLLSQWTRHLPFALVGGTVVMAMPAVLVLLVTPGLLVRRLGWALGWGPGLTTMVLVVVVVGQFLLLVDLLERLRQRHLTLHALLNDLGEHP